MEPSGAARAARVMAPRTGAWGVLRARRGVRIVAVALLAMAGAACATKRDVRDLREQIAAMQARQDSLLRVHVRRKRALVGSERQRHEVGSRVRGSLGNELALRRQ